MKTFLKTPRRRATALATVVVTLGLVATAVVASTASGGRQDTVTLRVGLFGDFGYHDLYAQYMRAHPNVEIKEEIQDYGTHHTQLAQRLATGAGAADIEAVEVGFIPQFTAIPSKFVDLRQYGATGLKGRWLPWKYQQAVARSGQVIGLGTDVGSLAICYRKDLFKKAGLPTNRDQVSKLWPTWDGYIAAGKRFQAHSPKGVRFFDSGSNVYNAMIAQISPAYYDAKGKLIAATNARVKAAWSTVIRGWQQHQDALAGPRL